MTFLDHLNSPKFDFTQNRSGSKMINFQQSKALTSHFESFWSIVDHASYVYITVSCLFIFVVHQLTYYARYSLAVIFIRIEQVKFDQSQCMLHVRQCIELPSDLSLLSRFCPFFSFFFLSMLIVEQILAFVIAIMLLSTLVHFERCV